MVHGTGPLSQETHVEALFKESLKQSPCLVRQVCVQIVQALLQAHDRHQLKLERATRAVFQLHKTNPCSERHRRNMPTGGCWPRLVSCVCHAIQRGFARNLISQWLAVECSTE